MVRLDQQVRVDVPVRLRRAFAPILERVPFCPEYRLARPVEDAPVERPRQPDEIEFTVADRHPLLVPSGPQRRIFRRLLQEAENEYPAAEIAFNPVEGRALGVRLLL